MFFSERNNKQGRDGGGCSTRPVPSQNIRRLNFSQKSTSSKFDQVYTKKMNIYNIKWTF
jgi:hypothetical protein